MLSIELFGSLRIAWQVAGQADEEIALRGRPVGLLVFLALARGHFFSRGELAAALWGDSAASGSIGCFNTTLWRLRKSVERPPRHSGDVITCDRQGAIGIAAGARCRLDTEDFERLVLGSLAKPLERLDATDVENLREGAARYRDDILAGFADDWALREREKQRRHYFNALGRLMQISALAQDYAGAIGYAQRILDRDILREDVHRELMRLLLASGQRALALRQFERCRDALRRELAIQPMRETMALYQQIATRAIGGDEGAPDHNAVAPVEPAHAAPRAFVDNPADNRPAEYTPADSTPAEYTPTGSLETKPDARGLIEAARLHLALADRQLERTLARITPPSPPSTIA